MQIFSKKSSFCRHFHVTYEPVLIRNGNVFYVVFEWFVLVELDKLIVKSVYKRAYKQFLVAICSRSIASKSPKGFCRFLFNFLWTLAFISFGWFNSQSCGYFGVLCSRFLRARNVCFFLYISVLVYFVLLYINSFLWLFHPKKICISAFFFRNFAPDFSR